MAWDACTRTLPWDKVICKASVTHLYLKAYTQVMMNSSLLGTILEASTHGEGFGARSVEP